MNFLKYLHICFLNDFIPYIIAYMCFLNLWNVFIRFWIVLLPLIINSIIYFICLFIEFSSSSDFIFLFQVPSNFLWMPYMHRDSKDFFSAFEKYWTLSYNAFGLPRISLTTLSLLSKFEVIFIIRFYVRVGVVLLPKGTPHCSLCEGLWMPG